MSNPKSTASIFGHPIHPMLIPFPIAFFVGALACDLAFWHVANPFWFMGAEWLLGAGLVMAALAALAGLTDLAGDKKIQNLSAVWWHAGGNVIVVLIEAYNFYIRYTGVSPVLYTGLSLSVVSVAILLFNGWMGWEMVYRHRVGVADNIAGDKELINIKRPNSEDKTNPSYNRKPPPDAEHRV